MTTRHKHLAVIGRVSGNDEDDVNLYTGLTLAQAGEEFTQELRESAADPDAEVYVNYILTSESPIDIQERNV
jgi:hypothetical protein